MLEAEIQRRNKMMEQVRVNFTTTFSNITNIYSKIMALRSANALKCSKKKCNNLKTKVKKMNTEIKFLNNLNLTSLDTTMQTISTFSSTVSSLETNLTTVSSTVTILETNVTSNTEKIVKVDNCFADINSADCPSARTRRGKAINDDVDEEDNDIDHSEILGKSRSRRRNKTSKTKRGPGRQSTTPLVPQLKTVLACMADNTASACTAQYRSVNY